MLKIQKTSVCLDTEDLIELERIVLDEEASSALKFLKRIRSRIEASQVRCGDKKTGGDTGIESLREPLIIEIFGQDTPDTRKVKGNVEHAIRILGITEVEFIEVQDEKAIKDRGVTDSFALIINARLMKSGKIPTSQEIIDFIFQERNAKYFSKQ